MIVLRILLNGVIMAGDRRHRGNRLVQPLVPFLFAITAGPASCSPGSRRLSFELPFYFEGARTPLAAGARSAIVEAMKKCWRTGAVHIRGHGTRLAWVAIVFGIWSMP